MPPAFKPTPPIVRRLSSVALPLPRQWLRCGAVFAAMLACAAACASGESLRDVCVGKCDDTMVGWKARLAGRSDPIANWLLGSDIDDAGDVDVDFGRLVSQVADQVGCSAQSIRTFVISDSLISGDEAFPRLVSTVCTDDDATAPDLFVAAAFRESGSDDVDVLRLEMFGWDPGARIYRFYRTEPMANDTIRFTVDPPECQACHLGPSHLDGSRMAMLPIMNELTAPWTHWNAEPDFRSHDHNIPQATAVADNFRAYGLDQLGPAVRFEQIIRAGHARVAGARARQRHNSPPSLEQSMSLLRPAFCDEQINYATEDFTSGVIDTSVLIRGGIREAYFAVSATDWPWHWLNDTHLRFPVAVANDALAMVPVRGNADIDYESRLMAFGTLTPHQVLRVQALDWKRPVLSEFRCALWKRAAQRFESDPPALDPLWRNAQAMSFLFEKIMHLDDVPLLADSPDQLIALDVADGNREQELGAALRAGTIAVQTCGADGQGFCPVALRGFGDMLDAYATSIERRADAQRAITLLRDERLCVVRNEFKNAPALPALSCF